MPEARPTPLQVTARTLNRIRTRGAGEVLSLAATRLRKGISSEEELIMFVRPAGGEPEDRADLVFRAAMPDDATRFARDIGTESPATFRSRLSQRTRCYLVEHGSLIVHATWATDRAAWTREIRSYFTPPPGDVYVYESFTRPEVRGQGVYPFALQHICSDAQSRGSERLWVAVEADNPSSIRAVIKAGFTEAFRLSYKRRWGRLQIELPSGAMAGLGRNFVTKQPHD